MEIKEMPIEEKYDKLLDLYVQTELVNYALHKELGTMDKRNDMMFKVWKKIMPSYLGVALKMMKAVAPVKTFKKMVDGFVSMGQITNPLSNLEVTWASDREVAMRTKNCPLIVRGKELAKKAGLEMDPKEICKNDQTYMSRIFEELGIDATMKLEENGCRITAKLK